MPAFIVSPRAEAGAVLERIYDHTSILKSILVCFLPGKEHRLGRNVEFAAHLGGAVPLDPPRSGFSSFALRPPIPANGREILDAGNFHEHMRTTANPMRLPEAAIRELIPKT